VNSIAIPAWRITVADSASLTDTGDPVLAEIQAGTGLSLSAAGRLFPGRRGNCTVDPSTVFRWLTKGAKASDGRVVRLEAVRVGGRWLTSRPAVARFVDALTAAATPDRPPPAPSPAARSRAAEQAAAALERMGA
jgi:hypothetical protein